MAKAVTEGKEADRKGVAELRQMLRERSRLPVFSFREFIGLLSAHRDDPNAVLLILDSRDQGHTCIYPKTCDTVADAATALSDSFSPMVRKFRLQLLGYLLFASLND
jgi:hypothetical protein